MTADNMQARSKICKALENYRCFFYLSYMQYLLIFNIFYLPVGTELGAQSRSFSTQECQ